MRRSDYFFFRRVGDIYFLQSADVMENREKKIVFLNETGAFLWNNLDRCNTEEDLVQLLFDYYEVERDKARKDVSGFLSFLSENGCIDL